jgi:hypothetical protein
MTRAAILAERNLRDADHAGLDLREPEPTASNGGDEPGAGFGPDRPVDRFSALVGRDDLDSDKVGRVHLAEALAYRLVADEMRRAA